MPSVILHRVCRFVAVMPSGVLMHGLLRGPFENDLLIESRPESLNTTELALVAALHLDQCGIMPSLLQLWETTNGHKCLWRCDYTLLQKGSLPVVYRCAKLCKLPFGRDCRTIPRCPRGHYVEQICCEGKYTDDGSYAASFILMFECSAQVGL
jgi:hypothetical protein